MSQQPAPSPSIPSSPAPGKDPPLVSASDPHPIPTSTSTSPPTKPASVPMSVSTPTQEPSGEHFDRDGEDAPGKAEARRKGSLSMPPPPPTNPRRTSARRTDSGSGGAGTPLSPGIILTQPTFEFRDGRDGRDVVDLRGAGGAEERGQGGSGMGSAIGAASGNTALRDSHNHGREREMGREGNPQHSLLDEGAGLGVGLGHEATTVPRPVNFAPFFTLVNDVGSISAPGALGAAEEGGKIFHPKNVHYIFADDEENGVLTEALVRSIDPTRFMGEALEGMDDSLDTGLVKEKGSTKGKAKARVEREERVVIVDVNEAGDGIKGVWSANPNWAVLSAEIGAAPTWDGQQQQEEDKEGGIGGLMLRIEGVGVQGFKASDGGGGGGGWVEGSASGTGSGIGIGSKGKGRVVDEEEMLTLLEGFDAKMAVLRRIVASGEEFDRVREGGGTGAAGERVREV